MIENACEIGGAIAPVQRDADYAALECAEKGDREFDAIGQQNRQPVAFSQSACSQEIGEPVGGEVELAPVQAQTMISDGQPVRPAARMDFKKLREIHGCDRAYAPSDFRLLNHHLEHV